MPITPVRPPSTNPNAPRTPATMQGPAMGLGQQMYETGSGLLGNNIAGNGVGQVQMNHGGVNNPYLNGMADNIENRTNNMLGQNNLNIQGSSVASGGLGGSRQGVAQGVAAGQAADYMSGNLANMFGTQWNNQQNRNLEQYQGDQNFYTQQRGQDLMGAGVGSGLITQGLNTQWLPLNNAANIYNQFQGNGTTTNTTDSGGGWQGAVGGMLGGASFGHSMGWW